jgi:hypothetical protein
MRRMLLACGVVLLAAGAALTGCPATHGGYPDNKCKIDKDCYQGEICDVAKEICIPIPPDMSANDLAFPYDFKKDDMPPMPDDGGNPDGAGDDM